MKKREDLAFEESLSDDWSRDLGIREVPLKNRPIFFLGASVFLIGALMIWRILFLGVNLGPAYAKRASLNLNKIDMTPAPRGLIYDRFGKVLADNRVVFSVKLDTKNFLFKVGEQEETLSQIRKILGISPEEVWQMINDKNPDLDSGVEPVVLSEDLSQPDLLALKNINIPAIEIKESYKRFYPQGEAFASILGYTGLVSGKDLEVNPSLTGEDYIGKAGIEASYNGKLIGTPGIDTEIRNAKGEILGQGEKRPAKIGQSVELTIDGEFQAYFYKRMSAGLRTLGRTTGVGIAMNPETGEVLSMMSFPSYDNNIFNTSGKNKERKSLLTSPLKPLFNRAVGGTYAPGSTIKPLVGAAALTEGIINPDRSIFSPGYLDVPNPYDPLAPTRFLDWRYQGNVNLYSAIAQSSNVYFYTVGGGTPDIKGLGISRLHDWWVKFGLGSPTGIDLSHEASGFLPTPEWKEKSERGHWLLGDTYNVSIGQGDLQITPFQLLDYISAIANGGKMPIPFLNSSTSQKARADLTQFFPAIREVQKGMRAAVTLPLGTAYTLKDLPFAVAAKTGSAQVQNNATENALFVGYAPYEDPKIAILVLIEHSKEGSLNALPIAKDVLAWYYENRIKNH
ncbi:MAG: penicillin-binding protein 2 [Candidatus Liptonbacteria bacterium]|nr:penicillin-binding protein 2 [Candidatus Liptonbacteria bacterium]